MTETHNILFEKHNLKIEIITVVEWVVLIILFFSVWRFTYVYSSGPISWDELWYMHESLNPEPFAKILNRYFHIYFQKIFFAIAGNAFEGAKLFWSFLFSVTTALIYVNARLMCRNCNYLNGLGSILIFFSVQFYVPWVGVTYPDFTVMMMVSFGVTLYLAYHRFRRWPRFILGLLGVVSFLAFKSKETGIVLCILIAGLGFDESDTFNLRQFVGNGGSVVTGVLIGALILMGLDRALLDDAFFGLRPALVEELLNANFGDFARRGDNWYSRIMNCMPGPFFLFIISAIKARDSNYRNSEKVVWLLPVGLLMFLTFVMIELRGSIFPRFYLPALPIIAVLGSQVFVREAYGGTDGFSKQTLSFFGVLAAVVVFYSFIGSHVDKYGWDLPLFQNAIMLPIVLSLLFVLVIFVNKWGFIIQTVALVCMLLMTAYPVYSNVKSLRRPSYASKSEKRFAPLAAFSDRIICSENARVFISKGIFDKYRILSRDIFSSRWMFNLYFDCDLSVSQFSYSACDDGLSELLNGSYMYVYITIGEWNAFNPMVKEELNRRYSRDSDKNIGVCFLWRDDEKGILRGKSVSD